MKRPYLRIDVFKLGVPVRMRASFPRLAVALEAVAGFLQQCSHGTVRDWMPLLREFVGQPSCAFAGPAQRRFRITARDRVDERFQGPNQLWVSRSERFATPSRSANSRCFAGSLSRRQIQFLRPGGDCRPRQASGERNQRNAAPSELSRLGGSPLSAPSLVHLGSQHAILSSNLCDHLRVLHAAVIADFGNEIKLSL